MGEPRGSKRDRRGARRTALALILGVAAAFGRSGAARGQSDPRELFEKGKEAYGRKDFEGAITIWRQSLALRESSSVRINLGDAYEKRKQHAKALCHYERALSLLAVDDPDRARTQESADRVRPLVGRVDVVVSAQDVDPSAAELQVDAEVLSEVSPCADKRGAGRWLVPLDPGKHSFSATASDRLALTSVAVAPDQTTTVTLALAPKPRAPVASSADWRWPVGFSVAGVGVASLVAGGVAGGLAIDRKATAERICPDPAMCTVAGKAAATDAQSFGDASTGLIVAGAAVTTAGVVMAVLGRPKKAQPTVVPVVGQGMGGVVFGGQF